MATIHPTAIVEPTAQLSDTCKIGPHCYIGGHVKIGDGTEIRQGSHVTGKTTIGKNNNIYPYCCIGTPPQDVSYRNEMFAVQIGDSNTIREFSTINIGTAKEQGLTAIGNGNFMMAYVHIGHDCVIGNHTIIINNVGLSGHTHIEDHAIISGLTGVHHFVTIGKYSFVGGMSGIYHDVPPYMMVAGNPQKVHRVNTVGLQRHGFTPESIDALKAAHRILYRSKLTRVEAFQMLGNNPSTDVRYLIEFLDRQMNGRQGRQREIVRAGVKH